MLSFKNAAGRFALPLVALLLLSVPGAWSRARADDPIPYPETKRVDVVDDYHGVEVADPYRWLEDDNAEDTKAWVQAQNQLTFAHLKRIVGRGQVGERITKLYDYERCRLPQKRGGRYFFRKNDGLQNQDVLYTMNALENEPRVLLDPNGLSKDGTIALKNYEVSEDGKLMAYSLTEGGSDWVEFKVRKVDTGEDLSDHLRWVKFSGAAWTHDNKGFFYSRYDEPKTDEELTGVNYFHKLYYHKIGTPQSQDVLVYDNPEEKEWGLTGEVTDDGRYLIISIKKGTERKNRVYYKDLNDPDGAIVKLIDEADARYGIVGNDGPVFWIFTDNGAPRGRIIAVDTTSPARENWKEIIKQDKSDVLRGASVIGDMFVCRYLSDAHTRVKTYDLEGKYRRVVKLPSIGTARGFYGRRQDTETFYAFANFTTPTTIFRYDVASGNSNAFRESKVEFEPGDFKVQQVFYKSKDGTKVPMFIAYKKGMKRKGENPTLLYGYGGFNAALTPWFDEANLVWMELGGIYAVANIRGGGEYGKEWHEAGMKLNRQNVFDDFIAAAEYLIEKKYTCSSKLAIRGGSNGGLLVGACMMQRPELFGACIPEVGVMDMLRFHKFTIGWAWTSDYGCSDNPEEFTALYAYSPLHNIKPGTAYPATLITTADHDDRVVPAHSFKFAAALQAAQSGPAPILIRIEERAGHAAGTPTSKRIKEDTDILAFLLKTFDMKVPRDLGKKKKKAVSAG